VRGTCTCRVPSFTFPLTILPVIVVDFIDQSVEMEAIRESPTYPSPFQHILIYYHLEQNVGLGEGKVGKGGPEMQNDPRYQINEPFKS